MLPPALVALRAQTYDAHQRFITAFVDYHLASMQQPPPPELMLLASAARAAGEQYQAMLTALLEYLDPRVPDAHWTAERDRTQRARDIVQQELALLPETGSSPWGAAHPAPGVDERR